jgi:hypothetical protein
VSRLIKHAFLANIVLSLSFLIANYFIWGLFDNGRFMRDMNPLTITMDTVEAVPMPPLVFLNFPFWLFWLLIAVNLFFIIKLLRNEKAGYNQIQGQKETGKIKEAFPTRRTLKFAVLTNAVMGVAFLAVNIVIWRYFMGYPTNPYGYMSSMTPFWIIMNTWRINGEFPFPNFPFWIFWIVLAVNMYFIIELKGSKETPFCH